MGVSGLEQFIHAPQRVLASHARTEAVALCGEGSLENRFQHHAQRRLDHPVLDGRYAQGAQLLASRLRDVVPPDRLGPVNAGSQAFVQPCQVRVQIVRVILDTHVVHPRRTAIGLHRRERRAQRGNGVEFVDQAVPSAAFNPLYEGRQHPRRPDNGFGPWLSVPRLSGSFTQGRPQDCHRCVSLRSSHRVSTFLPPFAPPALPGFNATMRALTPARGLASGLCGLPLSPLRLVARVSSLHVPHLPGSPSPSTAQFQPIALSPVLSASEASRLSRVWASPFHRRLANCYGRTEFVILRIARSPRVAPHLTSR